MLAELTEGAKRNPIWFGAVATITGVQGFFAWEFWGAISADPAHQLALRALGVSFVAGEVVALDMASRADLNQEHKRATRTRQRRWYVVGRALDELMEKDAALRAAVLAALDRHLTRRDERQLVGLAIHPTTK